LIDPAHHVTIDAVDLTAASGLKLVKVAPPVRYGVGRIELRIGRQVLGDIDITLCPVDRNGVIEHVRTDHRRLGYRCTHMALRSSLQVAVTLYALSRVVPDVNPSLSMLPT
jgi:hypothetical protein